MLKRISRIENDVIRIGLLLAVMPAELLEFAVGLAWNAPHRFFKREPWAFTAMVWRSALFGCFVGR